MMNIIFRGKYSTLSHFCAPNPHPHPKKNEKVNSGFSMCAFVSEVCAVSWLGYCGEQFEMIQVSLA